MASFSEAFLKFSKWKNFKTVLNLAVYTKGTEDHWRGAIFHVDEPNCTVGFVDESTRTFLPPLDLEDASFVVEGRRIEATRGEEDKLVFEELRIS